MKMEDKILGFIKRYENGNVFLNEGGLKLLCENKIWLCACWVSLCDLNLKGIYVPQRMGY